MPTIPTSAPAPEWQPKNLTTHHQLHGHEVATVLGQVPTHFGETAYVAASKQTLASSRIRFKAEHWDSRCFVYEEKRTYFVDRHLLQAVANAPVDTFITYFPETFDKTETPASLRAMTEGDKLMKFKTSLTKKEGGGIYQNVEKLHGFV